jgi:hypothetical protein
MLYRRRLHHSKEVHLSYTYFIMNEITAKIWGYLCNPLILHKPTQLWEACIIRYSICRSNATKYDLVFLEALTYQSYYGLIHLVGSPPVIGILSLECFWTAGEATGTPSNPAFVPEIILSYGNRMTFYERLQNMLFWLWIRSVHFIYTANSRLSLVTMTLHMWDLMFSRRNIPEYGILQWLYSWLLGLDNIKVS